MSADSSKKTIFVAASIALFCSILVSSAAVLLKPLQDKNRELERKKNVLISGGLLKEGQNIEDEFKKVTPILVDLKTGNYTEKFNAIEFQKNLKKFMSIKENTIVLSPNNDNGGLRVIPSKSVAYIVKKEGAIKEIILPVYGKGLWSTVYGFIAVESDGVTVKGITFYEHGETPGLGGEIENPLWTSIWKGKKIYDEKSSLRIEVIKGMVNKGKVESKYQIDGLSGATLTGRGVSSFVRFWLNDNGFGLLLKKLAKGGAVND